MDLEHLRDLTRPQGERLDEEQIAQLEHRLDAEREGATFTHLAAYQLDGKLDGEGNVLNAKAVAAYALGADEFVVCTRPLSHNPDEELKARSAYTEFVESRRSDRREMRNTYGFDIDPDPMSFEQFWGGGRDQMQGGVHDSAWGGYRSSADALQDTYRIVLGLVVDGPAKSVREAAAWEQDVVLLVRGLDFYTISTQTERWEDARRLGIDRDEKPFWAAVSYAKRLIELAQRQYDGIGSLADGGNLRASWLAREAASVLLDDARYRTKMEVALYAVNGSMTELAGKLHTDRANLYRLLPAGMKRRVR